MSKMGGLSEETVRRIREDVLGLDKSDERKRAELAVKVAELVKAEAGDDGNAYHVLSLAASLLFGVRVRLRTDGSL